MIDLHPLPLSVGPIVAVIPIQGGALVKLQAKVVEHLEDGLHAAGYRALEVGVLNAQVEDPVAQVGQPLVGDGAEQVPQVHKACGAGGNPGDLCPLRQIAGGIAPLQVLRCRGHTAKEALSQIIIVHSSHPLLL